MTKIINSIKICVISDKEGILGLGGIIGGIKSEQSLARLIFY